MREYIEYVLPVCYGILAMTGEEISYATPWEISMRLSGYIERMRGKRIFAASFFTAPIINSGARAPKRPVTAKKLLPEDFRTGKPISKEEKAHMLALMEESERRRSNGGEKNRG